MGASGILAGLGSFQALPWCQNEGPVYKPPTICSGDHESKKQFIPCSYTLCVHHSAGHGLVVEAI
jgi:hypothetical protein